MPDISYTLAIDGRPAPAELMARLDGIEMEQHVDMADILRLSFSVGLGDDGEWSIADEGIFARLTPLRLEASVGSESTETLVEAYVTETSLTLDNEPGRSTFEVIAMDPTVLMNLEEKVRSWPDMTDADIAASIFSEYGFDTEVEPTSPARQETQQTVIQRGTDIRFLLRLAARNGYECAVKPDPVTGRSIGHFHPPRLQGDPQGVLSVAMGEATNVNGLGIRFNMTRPQVTEAAGMDIETQSEQSGSAEETQRPLLGESGASATQRPRRELLAGTGLAESGELQTQAQAVTDSSAFAVTAEGDLNTAAYGGVLRAGATVNLRGAGTRYSGTYYVESVLHVLHGSSYEQHFSLRRNAYGLSGQEDFTESSALPSL